jgi:glycine/D-amino acid oxidase-like deaminating enzyme
VDGAAGAVVLADGSVVRGDAVVVAAGPWSRDLLPAAEAAALTLHRQSILYCDVPERWPALPAVALPGGAWLVPPVAGAPLALSAHSAARPVATITDHRTPPEWRAHLLERFGVLLDGLHPRWVLDGLDGYYLADAATGGARIVALDGAAWAFSASGGSSFKFAPLIARSLAARALGAEPATALAA